jgi:hypothetical protein
MSCWLIRLLAVVVPAVLVGMNEACNRLAGATMDLLASQTIIVTKGDAIYRYSRCQLKNRTQCGGIYDRGALLVNLPQKIGPE